MTPSLPAMMDLVGLPTGTVTFLLTDVEGSTAAWERDPEAMGAALPRSLEIVEKAVAVHSGHIPVERGEGDSRLAAFERAGDALAAAIDIQRAMACEPWPGGLALKVRIALHSGDARLRDERTYGGLTVHRAARLRSLGRGGQVLLSRAVHDLVADALPADVELVDLGTHRLRDLSRPEQVFAVRHPELPDSEYPLRSLETVPHNLPTQLSSFVGRVAELADVGALLRQHRLVTLTGPGGCGKSRLALEAAADAAADHPDGVWLVELSPVADPDLVPDVTLVAMGAAEAPGLSALDRVIDQLKDLRVLLLFDTCEHLIDAVASTAHALLSACPRLVILTTSREPLGVTGEVAWRVPPMANEPAGETSGGIVSEAVALFDERARASRPSFSLLQGGALEATTAICRRLDGIPLAIELAAARVRALPVERILAGLDDRFRLLSGGSRTALPRQRTLQASVEWSHDLLDERERTLFRRLSVFAGGFDLDAVEQVAAFGDLEPVEVFDVLSRLVDKSLVQTETTEGGGLRYRLLDTMRHFGHDRLVDAGEVQEARDRHLARVVALSEASADGLLRADRDVLNQLDDEIDDIRAALDWSCTEPGRQDGALAIVGALAFWWCLRSRYREGVSSCERALAAAGEEADQSRRRLAQWALGYVAWYSGDVIRSITVPQQLAAEAAATGDATLESRALVLIGSSLSFIDPKASEEMLGRAVELAEAGGDEWSIADAHQLLGWAHTYQDNWADAEEHLSRARVTARRWDSSYLLGWDLTGTATRSLVTGHLEDAIAKATEAQRVAVSVGYAPVDGVAMALLAHALLSLGRVEEAGRTLQATAARLRARPGFFSEETVALAEGLLALWRGDARNAVDHLGVAFDSAQAMGLNTPADQLGGLLALAHRLSGDAELALRTAVQAEDASRRSGSRTWLACALIEQARLAAASSESKKAEELAHEALVAAVEVRAHEQTINALEELAILAGAMDSWAEAVRLLGAGDAAMAAAGMVRGPLNSVTGPTLEAARAALDHETFDRAWAEGQGLTLDDAVAYARRARGERGRPSSGWDSLTATEARVVALVSEGLTNPQIAERLFIGRGTVKTHLAHVFTKLGVATRAELAAQASQRRPAAADG